MYLLMLLLPSLYVMMHVQLIAQLAGSINQRADSAVDEAYQWISDARSKLAWSADTDGTVDRDSIEVRISTVDHLSCHSTSDGEMIRDTALHRAHNAMQVAAESDNSRWSNCCRRLNDDWVTFTAELQHSRLSFISSVLIYLVL